MKNKFHLVLPCYNEAKSLDALASRALACAERRGLKPSDFVIVMVNNGSTDESKEVLAKLAKKHSPHIKIVTVEKNQGYGYGVHQGLLACGEGILGWSHADEQCDPEDAFAAWETLKDQTDSKLLVKGTRVKRELGSYLFSRCFEITAFALLGEWVHETNAQPKVFRSELMEFLTNPPKDFSYDLYVLLQAKKHGWKFQTRQVIFHRRTQGQSKWASSFRSRVKTIRLMLKFMSDYKASGSERTQTVPKRRSA